MAVGGLAAYLTFKETWLLRWVRELSRTNIVLIYFSLAALYFFRQYIFEVSFLVPFDRLIASIVFALIILEQCFSEQSFYKMNNFKAASKLGLYTYGFYCLHMIAIFFTKIILGKLRWDTKLWQVFILEGGMSLLLTIGIAYISYTLFESKFLKLKNKFAFIVK